MVFTLLLREKNAFHAKEEQLDTFPVPFPFPVSCHRQNLQVAGSLGINDRIIYSEILSALEFLEYLFLVHSPAYAYIATRLCALSAYVMRMVVKITNKVKLNFTSFKCIIIKVIN